MGGASSPHWVTESDRHGVYRRMAAREIRRTRHVTRAPRHAVPAGVRRRDDVPRRHRQAGHRQEHVLFATVAPVRVIQWATGGVGRAAIEAILRHPDLELVGVLGALAPPSTAATSARSSASTRSAYARRARRRDPRDRGRRGGVRAAARRTGDEVAAILALGQERRHAGRLVLPDRERRDARSTAACAEGGTTLHGTGINPGGITELFPLMFSALSLGASRFVRGEEFSDIRTYDAPDVVRDIMLFGGTPDEAMRRARCSSSSARGFMQSIGCASTSSGFALDAEIAHDARGGGRDRADRPTRSASIEPGLGRRAAVHVGGDRRGDR